MLRMTILQGEVGLYIKVQIQAFLVVENRILD